MYNEQQRQQLHDIAYDSIKAGLETGEPVHLDINKLDAELQEKRATFVTLHKNDQLRGCIGMLEPVRPLAEDVAQNAFAAAFSDHRFSPVQQQELEQLDIHISILGTPEEILFESEEDLVAQLRPEIDGLIMEAGRHRGTFLPSVWAQLPKPRDFLNHLKIKSGLPETYWSESIRIKRYTVEEF